MKIYYVSHPYGGKQKNEAKADVIVRAWAEIEETPFPDRLPEGVTKWQ